eukprot:TRINITY_DN2161_c1_g1_i1.p1 TRINITY_DN2161_c1_g1~~TRINITY_DN2161_c1_g1_i1.p1  ORF type:complete len:392 (-),score=72.53 TRINITY_DN2161_c1_g1_i1:494-1669(-)
MVFLLDNDLYFNVENNSLEKVNELLDDPKRYFMPGASYGPKRRPLLTIAVETGNEEIVKVLCSYGFSVHEFDAVGMTPLHLAVSMGNSRMVETLLGRGAKVDAVCPRSYSSPLHLAAEKMECEKGEEDMLSLLLQRGAGKINLNVRDLNGETPLMRATTFGHKDKIRLLLSQGADPFLSSQKVESAFSLLCQFPAVTEDHISSFMKCIPSDERNRRTVLNKMSGFGDRPIHMLIRNRTKRKIPAMKALLQSGASIDLKNWAGCTPLALACILKDVNAVRLLLVSGSSLQELDSYERSPLDIVLENNDHALLGLLARAGASLSNKGKSDVSQETKDWIHGRSKILRPLTYWARLSLLDYNRRSNKKIDLINSLRLPETLSNYLNNLEEDEES